jgi:hypothetical protein
MSEGTLLRQPDPAQRVLETWIRVHRVERRFLFELEIAGDCVA